MAKTEARQLSTEASLKFSAIVIYDAYDATQPKIAEVSPMLPIEPTSDPQNKKLYQAARQCKVQAFTNPTQAGNGAGNL